MAEHQTSGKWRPDPWMNPGSSERLRWWDGEWTAEVRTWDGCRWVDETSPVANITPQYQTGDMVNGHVLGSDNQWHQLAAGPPTRVAEHVSALEASRRRASALRASTSPASTPRWLYWFIGAGVALVVGVLALSATRGGGAKPVTAATAPPSLDALESKLTAAGYSCTPTRVPGAIQCALPGYSADEVSTTVTTDVKAVCADLASDPIGGYWLALQGPGWVLVGANTEVVLQRTSGVLGGTDQPVTTTGAICR